jgi:hypothetical protein
MDDARSADLASPGLLRDASGILHFGDAKAEAQAALSGSAVFDLQHLALIAVHGSDSEAFLQGQLSNDVREVTPTRAQASAWCSPKGRVLTCFLVFRHDGQLMLQLPGSLLETIIKRMRMYVLRAKATLEDRSGLIMRVGVVGEDAEARLAEHFGPVPADINSVRSADDVTVIRIRGRRPRFEILGPREPVSAFWNACRPLSTAAGAAAWDLLDIEAGVASIGPETSDLFVPQMLNLDRVGGLNFTKGCYVGQEIVARTQHLGRIKRRMYRAQWHGATPPSAGDDLLVPADSSSVRVQVVKATPAPAGGFEVLAVIPIEDAMTMGQDKNRGMSNGHEHGQFRLTELPYALDDETA